MAANGHTIRSDTDTELVAHLIEENYEGDLVAAVTKSLGELEGSMALAVIHKDEPGKIVAYREKSPLIIGLGEGENFLASDIPAILPYTEKALVLNDGEMAVITKDIVVIRSLAAGVGSVGLPEKVDGRAPVIVNLRPEAAEKAGFDHFMIKEIHEQPEALSRVVSGRIRDGLVAFEEGEFGLTDEQVRQLSKVYLLGCGTAYHACLAGKNAIERLAGIPAEAVLASEFRYGEPIVPEGTLCIAVSQSGETPTRWPLCTRLRREAWRTMAVVNQPLSSLSREVDDVMYQRKLALRYRCARQRHIPLKWLCLGLVAAHLGYVERAGYQPSRASIAAEVKGLPEKLQGCSGR